MSFIRLLCQVRHQVGFKMKKNRCYPIYSRFMFLILSVVSIVLSTFPLFIKTNEIAIYQIIWSILMLTMSLIMFIGFLIFNQYYIINDNKIVVKYIFGVIEEINRENVKCEVVTLDTYDSWPRSISKKWICLYDRTKITKRFRFGCTNKRKSHRIQIIYSEDNYQLIKSFSFRLNCKSSK